MKIVKPTLKNDYEVQHGPSILFGPPWWIGIVEADDAPQHDSGLTQCQFLFVGAADNNVNGYKSLDIRKVIQL